MNSNNIAHSLIALTLLFASANYPSNAAKVNQSHPPDVIAPNQLHDAPLNKNALHRLDFVVKGTSCPACLLKVQKRIEKTKGVAQAAVMLNKPYGAVCIYDSTKVDQDKVLLAAKGDEKSLSFDMIEDAAIPKIPLILIPHHSSEKSQTKTE